MKHWKIIQALNFNACWFLCVLGQNQWIWLTLVLLVAQIVLSPSTKNDLRVLPLAILGIAIDSALWLCGLFAFASPPIWLALLWLAFILNFGHSMAFLANLPLAARSLLGSAAGTYSYLIGWKLGALQLPQGAWMTAAIIAFVWALMLPTLATLDKLIRQSKPLSFH